MVRHYKCSALILYPTHIIPPLKQRLQHRCLCHRTIRLISLDQHEIVKIFHNMLLKCFQAECVRLVHSLDHLVQWVLRIGLGTLLHELRSKAVVDVQEVVGILTGIF